MNINAAHDLGTWHHDIDLLNGTRTSQLSPPYNGVVHVNKDAIAREIYDAYASSLHTKTVLDVACNAGGHLFSLNAHGISAGMGFDARDIWIKQAQWVQQMTNSSNLTFIKGGFEVLDNCGTFDISLFNGIFYHLYDPLQALQMVASKTREMMTINTMYHPSAETEPCMVIRTESKREQDALSGIEGVSWVPNGEQVLMSILRPLGFVEFRLQFKNPMAKRLCLFASKIKGLLK